MVLALAVEGCVGSLVSFPITYLPERGNDHRFGFRSGRCCAQYSDTDGFANGVIDRHSNRLAGLRFLFVSRGYNLRPTELRVHLESIKSIDWMTNTTSTGQPRIGVLTSIH